MYACDVQLITCTAHAYTEGASQNGYSPGGIRAIILIVVIIAILLIVVIIAILLMVVIIAIILMVVIITIILIVVIIAWSMAV